MYRVIHRESKADTMFGRLRIHCLWQDILRLTLWSGCLFVRRDHEMHAPPDIVELLHPKVPFIGCRL